MVAADQPLAFDLAFAEQRALMRAAALERAPAGSRPHERHVDAARRQGEGAMADEVARIGDAKERIVLHGTCSGLSISKNATPTTFSSRQEGGILRLRAVLGKACA